VGRTEKHKYDFRDHSRRLEVILIQRNSLASNFNKLFFWQD